MTPEEYEAQKKIIEAQHGKAEFDYDQTPLNEAARLVGHLKMYGLRANQKKQREKKIKKIVTEYRDEIVGTVEDLTHLLKQEFMVSFKPHERQVIEAWIKNTEAGFKEIADAAHSTVGAVKAIMSLDAFKILKRQVLQEYKRSLDFRALYACKRLLSSQNEAVAKDIAKLLLIDAGVFKLTEIDPEDKTELVMDKDKEQELHDRADKLRKSE